MPRNTNGTGFSLKDELFNEEKVKMLGDRIEAVAMHFSAAVFVDEVMQTMLRLELKQRIGCIATALQSQLPDDFIDAAPLIVAALPEPLDPNKTDNDFGDFIYAPLGEYVVRHGCTKEHLPVALETVREITMRFSMEDAIRHFLNTFPKETLAEMRTWTKDSHYHVRRLVSEGTRPLLPWSGRIGIDESETIPLLHVLHADTTRYVTRSVANHLNDISKEKPQLVVALLKKWKKEKKQKPAELEWMTRHALRTLIKQGNTEALLLLGYDPKPHITVSQPVLHTVSLSVGEVLEFSFSITAQRDELLMIDYAIDFVKANNKRAQKVYKIKKLLLKKGETVSIIKKHRFMAGASTLTFYPGVHTVALQINGVQYEGGDFNLT